MTTEDWARLGRIVKQWRDDKRLSQERISANGGPSDVVIGRIERNDEPRPRGDTLAKLDAGMGWRPGTSVSILNGGEPVSIDESVLAGKPVRAATTDELMRMQADLVQLQFQVSEEIQSRYRDLRGTPERGRRKSDHPRRRFPEHAPDL